MQRPAKQTRGQHRLHIIECAIRINLYKRCEIFLVGFFVILVSREHLPQSKGLSITSEVFTNSQ